MPNTTLGNFCFTNLIKRPPSPPPPPPSQPQSSTSAFLIKNFNSLYDQSSAATPSDNDDHHHHHHHHPNEPDLATVLASQRFFFSSPGRSNSIIESTPSFATTTTTSTDSNRDPLTPDTCHHHHSPGVRDSVAVPTISPDPYADFRRSMQEMVEAREMGDVMEHWEYLHELLLCYLNLNPKNTHKFIVGAFADLLVSLLSTQQEAQDHGGERREKEDGLGRHGCGGGCEISSLQQQQHM